MRLARLSWRMRSASLAERRRRRLLTSWRTTQTPDTATFIANRRRRRRLTAHVLRCSFRVAVRCSTSVTTSRCPGAWANWLLENSALLNLDALGGDFGDVAEILDNHRCCRRHEGGPHWCNDIVGRRVTRQAATHVARLGAVNALRGAWRENADRRSLEHERKARRRAGTAA